MTTKAAHPFWLDGMVDRATVEACPRAPDHDWWTFTLGEVLVNPQMPGELMTICRVCYVPRCGSSADEDRCLYALHHLGFHRYLHHAPVKVGA